MPLAIDTLVIRVAVGVLRYCLVWKTRMVELPDGEESLRICLAVLIEYRPVTDRRTDILPRHTPRYP